MSHRQGLFGMAALVGLLAVGCGGEELRFQADPIEKATVEQGVFGLAGQPDPSGSWQPLKNAQLAAFPLRIADGRPDGGNVRAAKIDAEGFFELELAEGEYTLCAGGAASRCFAVADCVTVNVAGGPVRIDYVDGARASWRLGDAPVWVQIEAQPGAQACIR